MRRRPAKSQPRCSQLGVPTCFPLMFQASGQRAPDWAAHSRPPCCLAAEEVICSAIFAQQVTREGSFAERRDLLYHLEKSKCFQAHITNCCTTHFRQDLSPTSRKEDFREAMRTGRIRFFLAGKIPHDGVRDFATQPFGWKAKPFGIGNSSNGFHPAIFAPHSALTSR